MCEYCGCQAVDAIAELTAEHELIVNLAGDIRRALRRGARDAAADHVRALAAILVPHTAVEEEALFPAMAGEFGEHVQGLIEEHREIDRVLGESAERTPDDPSWPTRLEAALQLLRNHILKEQDGVFPAALSVLTPAQWDQVDATRAALEAMASPA